MVLQAAMAVINRLNPLQRFILTQNYDLALRKLH